MKSKRTVLVTGCSSGIGLATCHVLSRNNFMTYGTVRNLSKAKKIQDLINMENLSLKILRLDVNDNQSIKLAVKKILTDTGRIDVLINNAGYGMFGPVEEITTQEVKKQFETNFFGTIRLIKAIVPIMRKQGNGTIVNISSMVGRFGVPLNSAYVSSKFAVEGLSESISFELEEFGIRVIVIEPGVVKSDFFHNVKVKGMNLESPYHKLMERRVNFLDKAIKNSLTSSYDVADTILEALNSKDPKFRYVIGNDATNSLRMRNSLSDRKFMEWIRAGIFQGKGLSK
ncbi:MAG: SDR family oxidoreductase [Nitrososphaeraceae archaeon]|jgi:NAD(P)-dependent dehydrogenase (short-subunit alcohol dehydrogenase family)|nr:SDR family oxidoreductase [Nitrososphaeraceae archaeon]MDW0155003.1 SDR family oxidoreductase [Nitrososphaeraceae archaeon]